MGLALATATIMIAPVWAAAFSQGYQTSDNLVNGSLIGLDPTRPDTVQAANSDRVGELFGVVVDGSNSLLSISGPAAKVQVVTTGTATTLVSNVNGDIKKGDAITASPINGVGMRATEAGRIIGIAQADFSVQATGTQTVKIGSKQRSVAIGGILVAVAVSYFTPKASGGSVVPQAVQNLTNFLAGKPVSTFRIIAAGLLLLLGVILAVIILNSAVRSSMQSIGRNPLAKSAVSSGLVKVLFLTFAILLVTFGSVYLVIKG